MEAPLLVWIHAHAHPWLDAAFVLSDRLATLGFCAALVALLVVWHLARRERRAALVWVLTGAAVWVAQSGLKALVARERPRLWPHLVAAGGASMPSGHALASAAFYPLLAAVLVRRRGGCGRLYWTLGLLLPLYIGCGRLYLGVHWPSDVLVGWAIGAAFAALAVRRLDPPARL